MKKPKWEKEFEWEEKFDKRWDSFQNDWCCSYPQERKRLKSFIHQTIDQEVKEAVEGFVKKIEKMKIDDLPNAICIKSEDYPEGDIVEGITYNTIIDNLLGKKEKGIDWSKKDMYEGIGRPDLKPKG